VPAGDPEELVKESQDAWLKGQYAAAIEASKKALRIKPGLTKAYQIIAVCSCSLRDADSARRAYERLDDRNKQLVRSLCGKSGVTIE
jgi:tetratricopeptide (TPR) repeat protein